MGLICSTPLKSKALPALHRAEGHDPYISTMHRCIRFSGTRLPSPSSDTCSVLPSGAAAFAAVRRLLDSICPSWRRGGSSASRVGAWRLRCGRSAAPQQIGLRSCGRFGLNTTIGLTEWPRICNNRGRAASRGAQCTAWWVRLSCGTRRDRYQIMSHMCIIPVISLLLQRSDRCWDERNDTWRQNFVLKLFEDIRLADGCMGHQEISRSATYEPDPRCVGCIPVCLSFEGLPYSSNAIEGLALTLSA